MKESTPNKPFVIHTNSSAEESAQGLFCVSGLHPSYFDPSSGTENFDGRGGPGRYHLLHNVSLTRSYSNHAYVSTLHSLHVQMGLPGSFSVTDLGGKSLCSLVSTTHFQSPNPNPDFSFLPSAFGGI